MKTWQTVSDTRDDRPSDVTIIIPFKDERERLPPLLPELFRFLRTQSWGAEVIFVDDGSVDNSPEFLADFLREPNVLLLRHDVNQGKGSAIRSGVLESRGQHVLFTDADFATPITELQKLLEHVRTGHDIAIGSRAVDRTLVIEKPPLHRTVIGVTGNFLIRKLLGLPFADTQCGFKLFHKDAARALFEPLRFPRWSFDYDVLYRAQKAGYRIAEVPVEWHDRPGSKFRAVADSAKCLVDLVRIRFQ